MAGVDASERVRAAARTAWGGAPGVRYARAPGRVNLIGEHTDYQDGLCLPMAIDRDVVIGFRPRDDDRIEVRSLDLDGTLVLDAPYWPVPGGGAASPAWGRTVAAMADALARRGRAARGFDAVVASDVPIGSGLSSSAAFELAVGLALDAVAGSVRPPDDLARAAQEAEHAASGVPCGIMDQLASASGRAGHALLLDCRTLEVTPVRLPDAIEVVVVHCGLPRALADSAYAARRAACEAAAARLGLPTLRDATPEQVADDPFARHVVSENARVLALVEAFGRGDIDSAGRLMLASHHSLAHDFAVSTPELDLLVELLMDAGALGARLTGAGFGGCCTAIAPRGTAAGVLEATTTAYRARTGLEPLGFAVAAADGAAVID